MCSSQNVNHDIVLALYKENQTVFRLNEIAMLTGERDFQSLCKKMNYYIRKGKLVSPRKGIYAKPGYDPAELACSLYTPSYISLEYVLQGAGIIFQYDSRITAISYLSRSLEIENQVYHYRKVKGEFLVNTAGIIRQSNHVNIATSERAFLDLVYLDKDFYFDHLDPLNKKTVYQLLTIYQSKSLTSRVTKMLQDG
jgi:hypothetical protein